MKVTPEKHGEAVEIPIGGVTVEGELVVPRGAGGIVLFAHGSGSSRFSPRNRYVAGVLQGAGLATLLMDLLTREEEMLDMKTGYLRFDARFLAGRVAGATQWLRKNEATRELALGYFGASTGAAAALIAATQYPDEVSAVVSRGGRPDLAMKYLAQVRAPTLLIVGSEDLSVVELNREALKHLGGEKRLEIVPGASHLFEEPGKLSEVGRLASQWFIRYLRSKAESVY